MLKRVETGFQDLTLATLNLLSRERIYLPITDGLYTEFIEDGIYHREIEIIRQLPSEYHPPILHTLITHVTKEKPVFIYGIGSRFCDDKDKARFIAASTDLLWCLSLIVDDLKDGDTQRAGLKSAWFRFGKKFAYASAEAAFEIIQAQTEEEFSSQERGLLVEYVNDSLQSLEEPALTTLEIETAQLLGNIDRRARFHCEYPIRALASVCSMDKDLVNLAINALFSANRGGQIINDLKDLLPSDVYGRSLFSDLQSGTSTVPLVMLYERLTPEEKNLFDECFGNSEAVTTQRESLQGIIAQRLPSREIYSLILINYANFLEAMKEVSTEDCFSLCKKWAEYKLSQAISLLSIEEREKCQFS